MTRPHRAVWVLGLLGVMTLQSACNNDRTAATAATANPPPIPVSVAQLTPEPVTVYEHYSAQTQSPYALEIRAQVSGRLEVQAVQDGARVKQGELLYRIDARDATALREQARAQLAQARAAATQARQTVERYSDLVKQGFISAQAWDNARSQAAAARAAVQAQQAAVSETELGFGYTTIRAPRDGWLSVSQVRTGELVTAQQTLLNTLYSDDPMWISFTVGQSQSDPFVALRGNATQRFQIILPDGTPYEHSGALSFVDTALDTRTGTLRVRLSVDNPQRQLRSGMFVRVAVPVFTDPAALRVPQQAVMELQGIKTVYVVAENNAVTPRRISAEHRVDQDWVVNEGLAAGDRIVVEGIQKLQMRPDARIQPLPWTRPPASPAVAQAGGPPG